MSETLDKDLFKEITSHTKTDYFEMTCGEYTLEEHNKILICALKDVLKELTRLKKLHNLL